MPDGDGDHSRLRGDRVRVAWTDSAPEEWSVVECHHLARLEYPDGPGHRPLIVEYKADGGEITLLIPPSEVSLAGLDGRVVALEILNEYLAPTAEQVRLIGRAEVNAGSSEAVCAGHNGWSGRELGPTVIAIPIRVAHGAY